MSIGCLLDRDHLPSDQELHATLGEAIPLWEQLQQFMLDTYELSAGLSFGGKKYGWNLWYRKSGQSLLSLYPQQGYLVAQVVLGKAHVEQALQLELGENVRSVLETTPQLHDGRWLFIPVRARRDADDVQQLLLVKRRPARGK